MVLDLLAALEAKSLIVAAAGGPDGRLRQLESIRLYARERLVTEGELARCERRFVDWLAGLAEDCLRPVFGAGPGGSRRLDVELDNLTLAADLAAAWRDPRRTVLATAVARGWRARGAPATARGSLDALPEPAAGPPAWRVRALREAAAIAVQVADYDAAARLAATAVDLARAGGDRETMAAALAASGLAHRCRRDHAAAKRHFAECADLLGRLDQPRQRVRALAHLAYTRLAAGDAAGATAVLADVVPDGYPYGSVALLTGDTAAANRLFTDTVAAAVPATLPYGLEGLAILADRGGEPARALRLAGAAAGLRDRFGIAPEPFWREQVDRTVSGAGRRFTRPGDPWADGRRWTSAEAVTYAIEGRPPAVRGTGDGPLTARERQVTDLLRAGRTNREIATELGISIRTVEAHLDHVRTKLDLRTRAELAVWAAAQAPAP
jgi:DNA-binding CsgD family transcriptional regulator